MPTPGRGSTSWPPGTLPLRLYQIGADGPEGFASLLDAAAPVPEVPVEPGDPAVIIYTGGTTGMQKGVELPQLAWIAAGYRYIDSFDLRAEDVHYQVFALFHNGGIMIG